MPLGLAHEERLQPEPAHCATQARRQVCSPQCWLTCAPATRVSPIVLPMQSAGPALLNAELVRDRDNFPALVTAGPGLPPATGGKGQEGRGYLSLTHTTAWEKNGRASIPTIISSGPIHLQLLQVLGCSPEHCSWLGGGSALLLACLQGQLSHDDQERGGPSTCLWAADQDFGYNKPLLLQGHRPRHGPWWHHKPGSHHGPRWHARLLIPGCSSPPLSL